MAVDVSLIKGYISDNAQETILKIYNSPVAFKNATKMVGKKGTSKVVDLKVKAVFGDGSGCGNYGDSDADFNATEITADVIATQLTFCEADLMDTFLSSTLTKGQLDQQSPSVEEWLNSSLIGSAGEELGVLYWLGDKALVSSNSLSYADGFIKKLGASGVALTGVVWTPSNAYDECFKIYSAYTGSNPLDIYLPTQKFRALVASVGAKFANNSAFLPQALDGSFGKSEKMVLPLSMDCNVYLDKSLDYTNPDKTKCSAYAYAPSRVVIAEDLATDTETTKVFRDEKDELLYIRLKFLFGLAIVSPDEVVKYVHA